MASSTLPKGGRWFTGSAQHSVGHWKVPRTWESFLFYSLVQPNLILKEQTQKPERAEPVVAEELELVFSGTSLSPSAQPLPSLEGPLAPLGGSVLGEG